MGTLTKDTGSAISPKLKSSSVMGVKNIQVHFVVHNFFFINFTNSYGVPSSCYHSLFLSYSFSCECGYTYRNGSHNVWLGHINVLAWFINNGQVIFVRGDFLLDDIWVRISFNDGPISQFNILNIWQVTFITIFIEGSQWNAC